MVDSVGVTFHISGYPFPRPGREVLVSSDTHDCIVPKFFIAVLKVICGVYVVGSKSFRPDQLF